jgi:hypothetical protein
MKNFEVVLRTYFDDFFKVISTEKGDWTVKGFIDIYKNIYTISVDTKVISKIVELMLFPIIQRFAEDNNIKMVLCEEQNHYPDITFIIKDDEKIALDLKSTYRINKKEVNGMTLGAFTGYFRNRNIQKNITFPYNQYKKHFVLGIIYSRQTKKTDERKIYRLDKLKSILSVVKDFDFFLQEKYKIASDRTGSGNTKNIGSVTEIKNLIKGKGPFSKLGIELFDDYWMNYLTKDMARAIESEQHYRNLKEYLKYRKKFIHKLKNK